MAWFGILFTLFLPVEPCWLPLNSSTSGKKISFVLPCRILEGNWKGMCGKKTLSSNRTGCKRMCQKSNVLFILLFYMLHLHNTLQLERKPLSIEAHAENGFGQTQSKFQRKGPKDIWHVLIILDGILPCLSQKFYTYHDSKHHQADMEPETYHGYHTIVVMAYRLPHVTTMPLRGPGRSLCTS